MFLIIIIIIILFQSVTLDKKMKINKKRLDDMSYMVLELLDAHSAREDATASSRIYSRSAV